ncbi:hypothetical protein SAMN04487779_102821 [Belnapia rosea]|uniref:Uncharacterized protein n=1 Tax=Belnapia rosea TaxID=938405 RepID=A0A1G7BYW0_9PROT|nr:hypothetical protein SAMN04487779_102821 [Belnapia rosea]
MASMAIAGQAANEDVERLLAEWACGETTNGEDMQRATRPEPCGRSANDRLCYTNIG